MRLRRPVVIEPTPIDKTRYVARDLYAGAGWEQDLDGIAWWDAPLPPKNHICYPQSRGARQPVLWFGCACGGLMSWVSGHGPGAVWTHRNSRKG